MRNRGGGPLRPLPSSASVAASLFPLALAAMSSLVVSLACARTVAAQGDRFSPQGEGTVVIDGLEIVQLESALREGSEGHWVARLDKWPLKTGPDGYRPAGEVPTTWSPNVEFWWNFSDGTGWISSDESPSVTHRYREMGSYTLFVEARTSDGRKVTEELAVEVGDRDLRARMIEVIEVDPATGEYEMTADVYGEEDDDELTITWKLDDEVVREGRASDTWRVRGHAQPGLQWVSAKWVAGDGSETEKKERLNFIGARKDNEHLTKLDEKALMEGTRTRFQGEIGGAFPPSVVQAEVRPFTGIFLAAAEKGQCRFQMTALDPERLLAIELMANLPDLGEEGKRYRYPASIVKLAAHPDADAYLHHYERTGFNELVSGRLGSLDKRIREMTGEPPPPEDPDAQQLREREAEDLVNEQLRKREAGFVQVGDREPQYVVVEGEPRPIDGGAPVSVTPFGVPKYGIGYGFQGVTGSVELLVVPKERIVGVLDLTLEGGSTYDRRACKQGSPYIDFPPYRTPGDPVRGKVILGECKELKLKGELILNLKAAPRDGVVRYDGCGPPAFTITGIYGSVGERHVQERPRMSVVFSREVDPATLNESTFQLTYENRSGQRVPVETTRLLRGPDSATLKPVEDLWGGVRYTARVKIGENGVRGYDGGIVEEWPESGQVVGDWYQWDFWTRLDFVPDADSSENLACHVYQTVRDAPLIRGKDAVAVISANWLENPRVSEDGQTRELPARLVLEQREADGWKEVERVGPRFHRPDLAQPFVVNLLTGAKLTFTPDRSTPETLRATVELETREGWMPMHRTLCSTPVWKHEPVLRIELATPHLLDEEMDEELQTARSLLGHLIRPLFPFRDASVRVGDRLALGDIALADVATAFGDESEAQRLMLQLTRARAARVGSGDGGGTHLVIGLYRNRDHGLSHTATFGLGPQIFPGFLVQNLGDGDSRALDLLVHQVGHALGLPDVPANEVDPRSFGEGIPEGTPIVWHDGIESASERLVPGDSGWIFLSSQGGFPTSPIMHPRDTEEMRVILRHHYLQIQEMIEDTGHFDP